MGMFWNLLGLGLMVFLGLSGIAILISAVWGVRKDQVNRVSDTSLKNDILADDEDVDYSEERKRYWESVKASTAQAEDKKTDEQYPVEYRHDTTERLANHIAREADGKFASRKARRG